MKNLLMFFVDRFEKREIAITRLKKAKEDCNLEKCRQRDEINKFRNEYKAYQTEKDIPDDSPYLVMGIKIEDMVKYYDEIIDLIAELKSDRHTATIRKGQSFIIYKLGEELFDPDSKKSLGVLEIVLGRGTANIDFNPSKKPYFIK